jgi:hypothetical protein
MKSSLSQLSRTFAAAALLCLSGACAMAEDTRNDSALRIASGPAGKIYQLMVRDIQVVCAAEIAVRSVQSSGGLQNLSLLSANESDLGIVQLDTLKDMSVGDDNIHTLQAVMTLHNNLLHIITLAHGSLVGVKTVAGAAVPFTGNNIVLTKFSQLKGLSVAVVGSAQLMGDTLEKQQNYGMQMLVADTDDQAVKMLKDGTVQAIFTLGGWPLPAVARHTIGSGLMLAEYDRPPQPPYSVVKRNYQNLDAFNRSFLAVPNVLVTRPFKPHGAMGAQVAALQACLRQHLDELQEGRYQAVWKEIKDVNDFHGIAAFTPLVPAKTGRNSKP